MSMPVLLQYLGRSRTRTCAWVALSGLGLSACAPLVPADLPVALPVPARYVQQIVDATPSPRDTDITAGVIDWHAHFTDPVLRGLLEQALANNRDMRAALLRVAQARSAYGIQRADRLPTLAASLAAARAAVPGDLNVTGRPVVGNQFQLGVGFSSWEIDFWGRVDNLNEAALQSYLASEAAQRAVTVSLIAQVANAYLSLRELDERLVLARRTLDSRAQSLRIFRRRVELGATSRLELTQVELLWRQAETLLAQLEQMRASQRHALALLVGTTVDVAASEQGLDALVLAPALAPGLPSDLLTQRPDIVAAEHKLKAARADIQAARAAFFPRIALTASGGTASTELDGLFQSGSQAWTFSPTLSLPIFDGGRLQAAMELAVLRRDLALVQYEQAIQAAFRDVSDALSAQHWLGQQVETLRATLALQDERARLSKLRYDQGAIRYLEVLDAERERLAVAQQLVQTRRAQLAAQVALYAALGGGASPPSAGLSGTHAE